MTIIVKRDLSQPMAHHIQIGSHQLVTDEPADVGGSDMGPNPHDLYDAALGACKALTLVWYAKRKGMPLEDVEVRIERDASEERNGTYRLAAEVHLGGPLSDEEREQLLAVAGKCPIHKLMTAVTTEVTTTLAAR